MFGCYQKNGNLAYVANDKLSRPVWSNLLAAKELPSFRNFRKSLSGQLQCFTFCIIHKYKFITIKNLDFIISGI